MGRHREDAGGYVKDWRSSMDDPLYPSNQGRAFTTWEAWRHLIYLANWKGSRFATSSGFLSVERGQLVTSISSLAACFKWSRGKTRRFLRYLENDTKIVQQTDRGMLRLTLCSYSYWNDDIPSGGQQMVYETDTQRTANGQQTDTSEEGKKGRREETDVRTNGRRVARAAPEPEPDPGRAALPAWWTPHLPSDLVKRCRNVALSLKGLDLVAINAVGPMTALCHERDPETILEVFTHFVNTRRKVTSITFGNFFDYYEQHEQSCVKAGQ